MANVQDQIAEDVGKAFDRPITVSVMSKLRKFPFLQELGFNGQLSHAKETFHGVKEANKQLDMYSAANWKELAKPWAVIRNLVPKNAFVEALMFKSTSLGKVGKLFQQMIGFDQTFAVSPEELKQKGAAAVTSKRGTVAV